MTRATDFLRDWLRASASALRLQDRAQSIYAAVLAHPSLAEGGAK